jgi:hypothetical protein
MSSVMLRLVVDVSEASNTSKTPVNFYQTTQRNIPEDSHFLSRRRENLKSHLMHGVYCWNDAKRRRCNSLKISGMHLRLSFVMQVHGVP